MTRRGYLARVGVATAIAVALVPAENTMTYQNLKPVASRASAVRCPACGHNVVMLAVGGHLQCPECTTVVESCCEGPIPSFTQVSSADRRKIMERRK